MNEGAPGKFAIGDERPLCLAILAMGGQGGGVLADWIVALAESEGWLAQSTSVPGVAQRTGATIYYIEMLSAKKGAQPVFALMPTPGDVDVVMAAEWMEAGRSVLRGLVTPERTTLIASNHRDFAISEKESPGDGVGDPAVVSNAADFAARRVISFDMEAVAGANGSVISAAMFGALAASRALPFERAAFEATIGAGDAGVEASLRAFADAFARTNQRPIERAARAPEKRFAPPPNSAGHPALGRLITRIHEDFPGQTREWLFAGVRRLVDYQDPDYADEYLTRVASLLTDDKRLGGEANGFAFTCAAAKYVALAMSYDDVARVADLKIRAARRARVRAEVGAAPDTIVVTTEYLHPRVEELCGALPRHWGEWLESRPALLKRLDSLVNRGRRLRADTLAGYLTLAFVAGLAKRRRGSLRHAREVAYREAWLRTATQALASRYELGVETLGCRRLIKGYSDTHARGQSKFDRVLGALPSLAERDDGAAWLDRLKRAALADEKGDALDGVLRTIATL